MTGTDNGREWALITGASAGIGKVFAQKLAREGMNCILVARRKELLEELAGQLKSHHGVDCRVFPQDLGEFEAPAKILEFVQGEGIEVEVLINNAGFGSHGHFCDLDSEWEMRMIDVNCRALVGVSRAFAPPMRQRGRGSIVHLASVASFQACPYMATYGATKAFVLMFSEALWGELKPHGVHVSALCPGPTESEFFQVARFGAGRSGPFVGAEPTEIVVDRGLAAMRANQPCIVSGFRNWIKTVAVRFFPRWVTTRVAAFLLNPKNFGLEDQSK